MRHAAVPVSPKPRDGGIEVWRALLMFLVVFHHACQRGCMTSTATALWLSIPTYMAVDGFVAISGLYGIRFTWGKWWSLLGTAIYWSLFWYGAWHLLGMFGVRIPVKNELGLYGGWFLPPYLALMACAPLLNAGIEALRAKGTAALWKAWAGIAVAFWLSWLTGCVDNRLGMRVWGWSSHCFATLCFVYVTMRVLALTDLTRVRTRWIVGVAGLSLLAMAGAAYYVYFAKVYPPKTVVKVTLIARNFGYNTPWVIAAAAALTLFAKRYTPPLLLSTAARFVGPSIFSVYLLHVGPRITNRWLAYLPVQTLYDHHWPHFACILLGSLYCFFVALALDLALRRLPLWGLRRLFGRSLPEALMIPCEWLGKHIARRRG